MKKISLFIIAIALSISVNAEEMFGVGGYYGYASPADLGDGDTYGLHMDFDFSPNFSARMGFGYMSGFEVKNYDNDSFIGYIGKEFMLDDIDIGCFEMGVIFKTNPLLDVLTFYCGAGFCSYYIPDIDIRGRNRWEDTTVEFDPTFGFWGCVGIEAGLPNFKVFVEVKGTWADNPDVKIAVYDWFYEYHGDVAIDLTNVQTIAGAKFVF